MPSKSTIVAVIIYGLGLYFHAKGKDFSKDQWAAIEQIVGLLADSVASLILYVKQLHNNNKATIQSLSKSLQLHKETPQTTAHPYASLSAIRTFDLPKQ